MLCRFPVAAGESPLQNAHLICEKLSLPRSETFLFVFCLCCVYVEQLDAMATAYPDRFKLWYTLDRPSEGWEYDKVMTIAYRNGSLKGLSHPKLHLAPFPSRTPSLWY